MLLDGYARLGICQRERSPSTASEPEDYPQQPNTGIYLLEESIFDWGCLATPNPSLLFNQARFSPEYQPQRVPILSRSIKVEDIAKIALDDQQELVEGPKVTIMLDNALEPAII